MKTLQDNINRLRKLADFEPVSRDIALRAMADKLPLYWEWQKKERRRCKAMARPMPGSLLGAFMDKSIKVGEREVVRVVPSHFMVLEKINSPLIDMLAQAESSGEAKRNLSVEDEWDICWIFTNDPERIFNLVREGGIDALRQESSKVRKEWDAAEVEPVLLAVFEQFSRHSKNKVKLLSDMQKEGNLTFFQEPEKAPAQNQPATAG